MNIDEAKSICSDFLPHESDGKIRCRHILAGDTCSLPKHFLCELVAHRDRQNAQLAKVGINSALKHRRLTMISVSRVGTLQQCPRLYQLRYVFRLKSPFDQAWKRTGTAFGDERANIDQGLKWSLDKYDLSKTEKARLSAVLRRYEEFKRPEELVCETECKFEHRGVTFIGYVDAETFDGKRIIEWKFAQIEYNQLKIARQAAVYFKGKPDATEFVLARARKPTHKPKLTARKSKKNPDPPMETPEQFEQRVYDEIDESWFTYKTFKRVDFDIDAILDQMVAAWRNQENLEELGYPPNFNPRLCDDCEYKNICENHLNRDMGCDNEFCATAALCTDIRAAKHRLENPDMRKKLPAEGSK
jgi:hypothetical protein